MFDNIPTSIEHIRAGRLRVLAVTGTARSSLLPETPTVADFLPGYEASAWYGIGAPKNTPAEIINKLNTTINAILADCEGAVRQHGRHAYYRIGRRVRKVRRRRNREVGQGGEVLRRETGLIRPLRRMFHDAD
jgi:hypothetical protein